MKKYSHIIILITIIFITGCSSKNTELQKSPCACLKNEVLKNG